MFRGSTILSDAFFYQVCHTNVNGLGTVYIDLLSTVFYSLCLILIHLLSQVVKRFAARPDHNSLISHICKEKGEDRWLTLLLIEMSSRMTSKGAPLLLYLIFGLISHLFDIWSIV